MAKMKKTTAWFCQACGNEFSKWSGSCPACGQWNTLVEEPVRESGKAVSVRRAPETEPVTLEEIDRTGENRISTGSGELDRVLGGGIVPGALYLIGGDPGIGKSTILLQTALRLAAQGEQVLYVSGEESLRQIALRAERLQKAAASAKTEGLRFYCETEVERIFRAIERGGQRIVVIDSIQTMVNEAVQASPGSVSQVRETTGQLLRYAKETGTTFLIVGHVTKDGTVAGPRVLEHMVDAVLYFEGDRFASYRILRGVKNRFGSTNEIGIFEMRGDGLQEVTDASAFLLSGRPVKESGNAVTCTVEGTRPLLAEVQALVTRTHFGFPKRQTAGLDNNRVSVLTAVLEKRLDLPLAEYDAYVNLAGGLRQREPSLDLAIVLALYSGYRGLPLPEDAVVFGEVGLSGEVRGVNMTAARIQEAAKRGFTTVILPAAGLDKTEKPDGVKLIGISHIREAIELLRQ